ncbi:BNR/Asp-box repeat protein, partial [gut metagenome]
GNTIVKDSAQEVTREIYPLFHGAVMKTFFTSGRICQSSRSLRPMSPQRLYASLATNLGAMVVFSDDFGKTWDVLGGMQVQPAPQGDEAKLVELPNGDVLLNCRARDADGRYLNIFHYTNPSRAEGAWELPVLSADTATQGLHGARCNGETLVLPVRNVRTGKRTHLILQSLPFGTDRSRVGIYYKECGEGVQHVSELAT